jgi:alkaline phosphatase D
MLPAPADRCKRKPLMGRPNRLTTTRTSPGRARSAGTSRREFFRRSGSAAAAFAAVPVLSLSPSAGASNGMFQHGVASGDPLADRVILWTRITVPARGDAVWVDFEIARDPAMTDVLYQGQVRTGPERDHTVKIDAVGLQPGSTYYYRFRCKGLDSPIGRTRTLPAGAVDHLRFAVTSCSNFAYGYFNAYARIAERDDLDLVLHLGDYIYEYATGEYGDLRPCEPPTEIITLQDYRSRHAQYKRDADSQAMHRRHPLIAIWDDHESANNAYVGGAENHTPGAEGDWAQRVQGAVQAYYEWMPVRERRKQDPVQLDRRFRIGNLVDLFMLEERLQARSAQLPPNLITDTGALFTQTGEFLDPERSLLGREQETWLIKGLRNSEARWRIIGQQVMMAQLKAVGAPNALGGGAFLNPDQWDGYQPSRSRIFDALKGGYGKRTIDNVIVLTGDIHSSWAADLTPDPNNPVAAAGGYDPASGNGSLAVEFVATSVSSPGLDDPTGEVAATIRAQNPHFKYIDLNRRGYMLLDITDDRVQCEWWHLDTVAAIDGNQTLAAVSRVDAGRNRIAGTTVAPAQPTTKLAKPTTQPAKPTTQPAKPTKASAAR